MLILHGGSVCLSRRQRKPSTACLEENSGSSPGATAQPQTSQSTMFHQILPPQHLDLKTTGEIAENWKL